MLVRERYICWSLIEGNKIDADWDEGRRGDWWKGYWYDERAFASVLFLIFVNYLLIYRAWLAVLKLVLHLFHNFWQKHKIIRLETIILKNSRVEEAYFCQIDEVISFIPCSIHFSFWLEDLLFSFGKLHNKYNIWSQAKTSCTESLWIEK